MDNYGAEPFSPSTSLTAAQGKDLFEPDATDRDRELTRTRKLKIELQINGTVNITEPPYIEDDAVLASLESYVLKAIAGHKYLQMSGIEVQANVRD